jgi:hypothetical protein
MRALTRLLALVVATLAPAGAARADVAPPDDYVDPCAGMTFDEKCRRCSAPEFKSRDCHEGARASGLVERCRGWNYAMYCAKDGASPPPPVPEPPPEPPHAPAPPPELRSPPAPPAPVQQPAPPPAAATGSGCSIHRSDAVGLVLLLLFCGVVRRRRAA